MIKISQKQKKAVVVGGANLDIKGYTKNYIRYSSSPGWIEESTGGVARNIAEDLALLAQDALLLTAVADDHHGDLIRRKTTAAGVNLEEIKILSSDKFSTGRYLAHLNKAGELMGAVADMSILKEINLKYLQSKKNLIKACSMLILDTNIEAESIDYLLKITKNDKINILIDAVSAEKSLKLKSKLKKIDYLRANLDEAEVIFGIKDIKKELAENKAIVERIKKLFKAYAEHETSAEVIISVGVNGSYLFSKKTKKAISKYFPAEKIAEKNLKESTGAGDALTAGIAAGLMNEMGIEEAIELGIKAASLTIESNYSSNPKIAELI